MNPESAQPSPALANESRPIRVLVIEDNAGDYRLIAEMVTESGTNSFELERAERLSSGLDRLAAGGIDLVLLDLSLPDSHGLATFAKAHAEAPAVPIIVMSGLADETVAVQAVHQGAQDYLVKGHVDGHLLVRAMRYAIERKRTAEQLSRYAEELRERNAQMEADLTMAREIQQVFLPQQYPIFPPSAPPEQTALRFSHLYLPAAAVSGDFMNIFAVSETEAGVFLCDVMGHGLRAALVTAIMRGLVEELMPAAGDAGRFLTEINKALWAILRRTDEPMLATAFFLIADVARGELRFASAGHPSALRLRRGTGSAEPLSALDPRHGPALGLFENPQFPTCRTPLAPGDLILLYTDGLYEIDGAAHEEYGQERLLSAVRQRVEMRPPRLFDELLSDVRGFSGRNEFEDDVCLVGVEVTKTGVSKEG